MKAQNHGDGRDRSWAASPELWRFYFGGSFFGFFLKSILSDTTADAGTRQWEPKASGHVFTIWFRARELLPKHQLLMCLWNIFHIQTFHSSGVWLKPPPGIFLLRNITYILKPECFPCKAVITSGMQIPAQILLRMRKVQFVWVNTPTHKGWYRRQLELKKKKRQKADYIGLNHFQSAGIVPCTVSVAMEAKAQPCYERPQR